MAYQKGDLKFEKDSHDARDDYKVYGTDWKFKDKKIFLLPHSCESWIIGGKEEAEALIADLQELIKKKKLTP